ncbi:hypothetical protein HUJ04_000308 [Dendroctonus ponderosae]|nr:hypothetical protein HUJ04_000308 [Dendroctonus ponderosae]
MPALRQAAGVLLLIIAQGCADYCEFGTCDENSEYCCGENKCCKETVQVWYYWAVVLLVLIIVSIGGCFYVKLLRNRYRSYRPLGLDAAPSGP